MEEDLFNVLYLLLTSFSDRNAKGCFLIFQSLRFLIDLSFLTLADLSFSVLNGHLGTLLSKKAKVPFLQRYLYI